MTAVTVQLPWPFHRRPKPVEDPLPAVKTTAALAAVDVAIADLRAALLDVRHDVVVPESSPSSPHRRRADD